MAKPLPVVLFDEVSLPISKGDLSPPVLERFLRSPAHIETEYLCAWVASDIFSMPRETLHLLCGLVPGATLIPYLEEQPDFHVRLLVHTLDRFREDSLRILLARGLVFRQEHVDQFAAYGQTLEAFRLKNMRELLTYFPKLKLDKLEALA